MVISLITTSGDWFDSILNSTKRFDFRKGNIFIAAGDFVSFAEASEEGAPTGRRCEGIVDFVLRDSDFPPHFNWNGPEFTIIQFKLIDNIKGDYRRWVIQEAMELGGNTCTHARIERRGGWIRFIAENQLIKQTHGYYDMNRYLVENHKEIEEQLWKLSETRKLMESQLNELG